MACKACLSTITLAKATDAYQDLYFTLTGIQPSMISGIEGFPLYFCVICQTQFRKMLDFKLKCKRAFNVMKDIYDRKNQVKVDDILTVNKKKANLECPLTYSKTENTVFLSLKQKSLCPDEEEVKESNNVLMLDEAIMNENVFHIDIKPRKLNSINIESEDTKETDLHAIKINNKDQEDLEEDSTDNAEENTDYLDTNQDFQEPRPEFLEVSTDFSDELKEAPEVCNDLTKILKDSPEESTDLQELQDSPKVSTDFPEIQISTPEDNFKNGRGTEFKTLMETSKQISEASYALSNAKIKCLSKSEQKQILVKALNDPIFIKAIFKCAMCLTVYQNIEDLANHVGEHNMFKNSKHICDICMTKFMDEKDLLIHKAEKHAYQYTCNLCKTVATFYALRHFIEHFKLYHEKCMKPKSDQLESMRKISRYFELLPMDQSTMYVKMTHPKCNHFCKVCEMKFMDEGLLITHRRRHKAISDALVCDICGLYFKQSQFLSNHMRFWHLYAYQCRTCGELFYNKYESKHHGIQAHKICFDYKCEYCGEVFTNTKVLKRHCTEHHYSLYFNHHCLLCGDSFSSLKSLYGHQLTTHHYISIYGSHDSVSVVFPCESCDINFTAMESYKRHCVKHGHAIDDLSGVQIDKNSRLVCYYCKPAKRMRRVMNYCIHVMQFHTNKPYVCDICNEQFEKRQECKVHIILIHALQKPYSCDTCGEKFTMSLDLNDHCKKYNHPKPKEYEKLKFVGSLYIYPHMKLNFSKVDPKIIDLVRLYIINYEMTKCELVSNIYDHIILNKQIELTYNVGNKEISETATVAKENKLQMENKSEEAKILAVNLQDGSQSKRKVKRYYTIKVEDFLKRKEIILKKDLGDLQKKISKVTDKEKDIVKRKVGHQTYDEQYEQSETLKLRKLEAVDKLCDKNIETKKFNLEQVSKKQNAVDLNCNNAFERKIQSETNDIVTRVQSHVPVLNEYVDANETGIEKETHLRLHGDKFEVFEKDGVHYISSNGIFYQIVYE